LKLYAPIAPRTAIKNNPFIAKGKGIGRAKHGHGIGGFEVGRQGDQADFATNGNVKVIHGF
jgi:hypothetical protein